MNDVYEFHKAPGKGAIWLSVVALATLVAGVIATGADDLIWLVWVAGALTFSWMLMPRPVAGIRIDDEFLVLSAWHRPRPVRLDDIAYLRASQISAETDVTIVYKDGTEEETYAGDMPHIDILTVTLASRGIAVRDMY